MDFVTPRQFCEALYCGFVPADAFAQTADGRIAFAVEVTAHSVRSRHEVTFLGIRTFTRTPSSSEAPEAGDRIELSVIELEREPDGWRVWFNPWYITEIEFHCHHILFDGAEVRGDGRWLQDDLPKSTLPNGR